MKKKVYLTLIGIFALATSICIFLVCNKSVKYTVTFDSMGGSVVAPQFIKEGELITKPEDPQKEGFTFVEWQVENTKFDFNTPVTNELTLIAYYTINEGTEIVLVTLDYQNGQNMNVVEIIKGGIMNEPPQPQNPGYKFLGWYIDNDKYDFSSKLDGNISLTAKWEVEKNALSNTINNKTENTLTNNSTINNTTNTTNTKDEDNVIKEKANLDEIVNKYSGRWYLYGYADVCIDISKYQYYDAMVVQSHNFSLPMNGTSDFPIVSAYTIYPRKVIDLDKGAVYSSSFDIAYDNWNECLNKNKVILGSDCIYINNYKFVRSQGKKDCYSDTCYKAALGTWYLYNNPDSKIEIKTQSKGDIENGDYFGINATRFNFSNFATNVTYYVGGGFANRNQDWEQYGISVNGDTLTITNQNGTRTFYRTKTYQKVTAVSLLPTDVSLGIGETKTIKATITPSDAYDKSITWSSSNPEIATVSHSGLITAKGEGTTTITVTTNDGQYTATCKVTVSVIHVSAISINKTSLDMTIGDSQQLSYTITPSNAANKNITWSSSDESVAQVSSTGKVTAKNKGTAVITVKTSDGGYMATCEVNVKEPKLTVIASIGVGYYMSNSASVRGVFVKAESSGGSGNYIIYSIKLYYNGTLVAEDDKNELIVTPIKNGTYTAEVYVKDSNGNEATITKTTTISY